MNRLISFASVSIAILGVICANAVADAVYVTSGTANSVVRIGANGVKSTFLDSDLNSPVGIAFDAAGNLYVSNGNGSIKKFPADGSSVVDMATGQNGPTGLAVGPDGVLYAAISGDNKVVKIETPGAPALFANLSVGSNPQGIAFDADGNLLVAAKGTDEIRKFKPNGTPHQDDPIGTNDVNDPVGVVPAGPNSIAVVDSNNGGELVELKLKGQGNPTSVVKQLGTPTGLALDSIGNYYVGTTGGIVKKVLGKDNAIDFATDISGMGQLTTRTAQFDLVAFKNEQLSEPPNTKFASFGSPIIGAGGDIAYLGKLLTGVSGVSSANDSGIWKTDFAGIRSLIAREGSFAPDAAGAATAAVFGAFSDPVVNEAGRVAFRGTLRVGISGVSSANASGLWAQGASGLALVARQGDQAPGLNPGAKFAAFQQFVLPDAGGLVFLAKVSGTGVTSANNVGLWAVDGGGVVQLVARKGDMISVNSTNKKITAFTLFSKVPFSAGQTRSFATDGGLLFRATFSDLSTALLSKDFGTAALNVVTFKNEVLTIQPIIGAKLKNPNTGAVNADLAVAFRSSLSGGGVTLGDNQAVFLRDSGGLKIIARKSFLAPGTGGVIFGSFSDPAINDIGEVAFRATLKGAGGVSVTGRAFGLWLGDKDTLELAVRQSDDPPGVPGSVKFASFTQFCGPAEGGLVFLAKIAGNGITTANNQGLWQRDTAGSLDLLVRKGDTLKVDGANRKVSSIVVFKTLLYCGAQGRNVSPNGGVALLLKFTDGYQAICRVTQP
jgi:sugar lactone lactonase YvrE